MQVDRLLVTTSILTPKKSITVIIESGLHHLFQIKS